MGLLYGLIFSAFLGLAFAQNSPDPTFFYWRQGADCANLNCPSQTCMNVSLPLTNSNGDQFIYNDDFCLNLRPGHQWTWEFNWTNPIFNNLCSGLYDGYVIRDSPFQTFIGADFLIWVSIFHQFLITIQSFFHRFTLSVLLKMNIFTISTPHLLWKITFF